MASFAEAPVIQGGLSNEFSYLGLASTINCLDELPDSVPGYVNLFSSREGLHMYCHAFFRPSFLNCYGPDLFHWGLRDLSLRTSIVSNRRAWLSPEIKIGY